MFRAEECRRTRVVDLYQLFLARDPDPDGREYWVGVLGRYPDIALAVFLAASDEYFRRAASRFAGTEPDTGILTGVPIGAGG